MSANIPFEIQSEIIKRVLPVKSLLRFRSVSKQWKSHIDSSEFIREHSVNQSHQNHILVRYEVDSKYKYVSIVDDDDSFPQNKSSPVVPRTIRRVDYLSMLDSSHGLVCMYDFGVCYIWNPSIRKYARIHIPLSPTALGFGVCPKTNDPKIVTVTCSDEIEPVSWKAEVFTLSSGLWRSISMNMHFSSSTKFKSQQVVIDGVIHWAISESSNAYCRRIISFDLISEEFEEVDLPDSLARRNLSVSKLNNSLVVLNLDKEVEKTCEVWMMRRKNVFEKLFCVDIKAFGEYELYGVAGFRKNGQPIMEEPYWDGENDVTKLEAYDTSTKHTCDLGVSINSYVSPFMITSYTESLLLLNNHSNYIVSEINQMSAKLPFEIQSEIIKRVLPVRSLLRFRSVSKQWKSHIDSSKFIANHSVNQSHQNHILVRYEVDSKYKYVSVVDDDDSFPQNKSSHVVPRAFRRLDCSSMLDSSHGLVCMHEYHVCVIWNPSIRKCVRIQIPVSLTALGFGVCPKTNDPKIVTITHSDEIEPVNWKAEIFTLSSRSWRSISINMHFSSSTKFKSQQVVVDGVIYCATSESPNNYCDRIISFDLISEEFGEVDLPDSLASRNLSVSRLNKSLVVLNLDKEVEKTCEVWHTRENGFEKLFTVGIKVFHEYELYGVVGFRKNGQPIMEEPYCDGENDVTALEAYEPSTKHTCDLGVYGNSYVTPLMITSYTESLLLLNNHSNYIVRG